MFKAPDITMAKQAVTVYMFCEHSGQDLFMDFSLPARSEPDHLLFSVLKNPDITKLVFNSGIVMKLMLRLAPGCAPNTWRNVRDPLLGSWLLTTSQTDDISFEELCGNHGVSRSMQSKPGAKEGAMKTKLKTLAALWRRIHRLAQRPLGYSNRLGFCLECVSG